MPGKDPVESCGFHCHLLWVLRGKELWGKMERNINILSHPTPKYPQFLRKKKTGVPVPFPWAKFESKWATKNPSYLKYLFCCIGILISWFLKESPCTKTRDCWFIPGILYLHQPRGPIQTLGIPDYFKACDTIHFTTFVDGTGNLDSEENNRRMMTDLLYHFWVCFRKLKNSISPKLCRKTIFNKDNHDIKCCKSIGNFSNTNNVLYIQSWNQTDLYLLKVNPPKTRPKFQPKQGSFGFQVYIPKENWF